MRYRGLRIAERPWVYPIRPEVPEALDAWLAALDRPAAILEIGTGTGIIACALAAAGHVVTVVDLLPAAVDLARANAARNGLPIRFAVADLYDGIDGRFDRIVFNVPNSLATTRLATLAQHVATRILPAGLLERAAALRVERVDDDAKRRLLDRLVGGAPSHLRGGGRLWLLAHARDVEVLRADPRVAAEVESSRVAADIRRVTLNLV
jgi:methylase of polypeptide subunit release factors